MSTCGVSSNGNVKVWHGPRASQPAWNRSRAQTSSVARASQQHPNDIASWCCRLRDFPIKSLVTHEIIFKIGMLPSQHLIPRP